MTEVRNHKPEVRILVPVIKDPDHKDTKDTKKIDYIGAETKKVKMCDVRY